MKATRKKMKTVTVNNSQAITGVGWTTNHTGKMEGMISLSTSVINNERCRKNAQIKGSVCEKCFAERMANMYGEKFRSKFERNQEILTAAVLPDEQIPIVNHVYARFEAFGDLNNDIQVINYFNICYKNPQTKFALWTKNPDFIAQAIKKGYRKPDNLQIILSSLFLNQVRRTRYDFIDKVFTVYTPDYIQENDIDINCGARNCFSCGLCYNANGVRYIHEKLK